MAEELGKKKFDASLLDAADETEMIVMVGGEPIDWRWRFAGPGHPAAIAQKDRVSKEALTKQRLIEQAQTNGKKWKGETRTANDVLEDNVRYVMERLLGWSPVDLNGVDYPFSPENATKLLSDPRKGALLQQAVEFLLDDNSFTPRSVKN